MKNFLTVQNITVKAFGTAKQGLKEILTNKYDCAIVDLNLPDMSGFKLLKLIQKENIHLPIIMCPLNMVERPTNRPRNFEEFQLFLELFVNDTTLRELGSLVYRPGYYHARRCIGGAGAAF
mgnify:CR=1 FL=1